MKFSAISLILSAGLAISQVSAAPVRVVVVSEHFSGSSGFVRVGHAIPNEHPNTNVATMHTVNNIQMKPKHGCAGSLRAKASQFSNWFRHVFGLPPISNDIAHSRPATDGMAHILPINGSVNVSVHGVKTRPYGIHHYPGSQPYARPHTFVQRLTRALTMLGPWEGRAVSFILGCGIGVLIRMFWVLAILAIRSIRGKKEEEEFLRDEVIFEQEEERLLPPPYLIEEKTESVEPAHST